MNKIIIVSIDSRVKWENYIEFFKFIRQEKLKQLDNIRFENDKKLIILSEMLIRCLACKLLNVENSSLKFYYNKYGKPYIKNQENFHYNVSRTEGAICCYISNMGSVGIDIETINQDIFSNNVANTFFTENERAYINSNKNNINERFLKVWTMKEAYLKYLGKGLFYSLKEFDVFNKCIYTKIKTIKFKKYIISLSEDKPPQQLNIVHISEIQLYCLFCKILKSSDKTRS